LHNHKSENVTKISKSRSGVFTKLYTRYYAC